MQTIKDVLEGLSTDTQKLRAGELAPEQANTIARLVQTYLNTLKLELASGRAVSKITCPTEG